MATPSPRPSLHASCNTRQSGIKTAPAKANAADNNDKYKQRELLDPSSRMASVFSACNYFHRDDVNVLKCQHDETSQAFDDGMISGPAKPNSSNLNDDQSKMSHSDTVAKCFECASYMPNYERTKPTSPNKISVDKLDTSCSSLLRSRTHVNSSSNIANDAATAAGLGGGIVGGHSLLNESDSAGGFFDSLWSDRFYTTSLHSNATPPLSNSISIDPYNIWNTIDNSSGLTNSLDLMKSLTSNIVSNGVLENDEEAANTISDTLFDLRSKLLSNAETATPKRSLVKRQMMIYHCRFGEFGVTEGKFTEPSGVAVNAQNYIIVADTNNHRIQIFDRVGRFKFQFGECGKRDSQLLYPNRVAVSQSTGDIIVTERSPTHQIQIFNQYGQFVRKFGSNILQHPRGLTVDNEERIIVVECKVMRVIIFDHNGNIVHKFGCSKQLRFPNGVAVNDKKEIFISDNRAHCVKVFNYEGRYLRQIGCEGLTNYPVGVCINSKGQIIIADNHNNFNLTVFTQDGQLISAHESRVKHAQCFDVALIDENSVVLASKDYRLYIYRFAPALPKML